MNNQDMQFFSQYDLQTFSSSAKWILTGEHTVIRNGQAIAFPLCDFCFKLHFEPLLNKIDIKINDLNKQNLLNEKNKLNSVSGNNFNNSFIEHENLIFSKQYLIDHFLDFIKYIQEKFNIKCISGRFFIESNIKPSVGLGTSAALSICMAEFLYKNFYDYMNSFFCFDNDNNVCHFDGLMNHFHKIKDSQIPLDLYKKKIYVIALELETFFHFKTSGLDIAVLLTQKPIIFQSKYDWSAFVVKSKFNFLLTFAGNNKSSSQAIKHVYNLIENNTAKYQNIDNLMKFSSFLAVRALSNGDVFLLKEAILLGHDAFLEWELITDEMQEIIDYLYKKGAIGIKPIGAGYGGMIVSLWESKKDLENILKEQKYECISI